MTSKNRKLTLGRETVRELDEGLGRIAGGQQTYSCGCPPTQPLTAACRSDLEPCLAVTELACPSLFAPCQVVSGLVCP